LSVVTGDVRGAGSSAPVVVTLFGDDDSSSESHIIGGEENQSFERATRSQYVLYSKSLGRLKRIVIEQLPERKGRSAEDTAWYLERIEVQCPDGHRYAFPCSSWFGRDKKKKNLMVAEEHKDTQRSSLHDPSPADRLTQPLQVSTSGFAIPHPSKVRSGIKGVNRKGMGHGGEDSYFYSHNSNGSFAVGVADGVYEWKLSGIDAGIFSRQLVEFCRQAVELGIMDALSVLQFASKHLKRSGTLGSSVVSLGIVDLIQGRLQTATIGDSGFLLLGRTKEKDGSHVIRYRSPQQEHSFGCPYQLGHQDGADSPEDAMLATVPVYPGDVLVFGSDGLFDNVSDDRIVEIVDDVLAGGGTAQDVCHALASRAFKASTDKQSVTPYSTAASQAFEMVFSGGKKDDISVVVSLLM
jgi:protein phosphatase PTC7